MPVLLIGLGQRPGFSQIFLRLHRQAAFLQPLAYKTAHNAVQHGKNRYAQHHPHKPKQPAEQQDGKQYPEGGQSNRTPQNFRMQDIPVNLLQHKDKNDKIEANLYLTAKSTINVLEDYFKENKTILKQYSKKQETGKFYIKERDDIESISVSFLEYNTTTSLIKVTVTDNLNNQLTLSAKIPYN